MAATKLRRLTIKAGHRIALISMSVSALLLAACTPSIPDDAAGGGEGAYGRSPTSVRLRWPVLKTAESYRIFNLGSGNTPIYDTSFVEANLTAANGFEANKEYTLSVRGVRGTDARLSDPLNTWKFTTWPTFTSTTFFTSVEPDGTTVINFNYAPWNSGLPATDDAMVGSEIACNLLPVDQGTDPGLVDESLIRASSTVVRGQLYSQALRILPGDIDASKTYVAMCKAKFVDATESLSTARFLINPTHLITACPSSVTISTGASYSCTPNVLRGNSSMTALGPYQLTLLPVAGYCPWATTTPTSGPTPYTQIVGSPGAGDIGTCNLVYYYTIPGTGYMSPRITQTVTVTAPAAYTTFPSFAVRAMSGALGWPNLHYQLTGAAADNVRARVDGDLITDFGAGSSFFAGGATPFPEFDPAITSSPLASGFFYGFPVAKAVMGVRPNGFSLDGIRQGIASNGSPNNEGFVRGSMIIPQVDISRAEFLTASGRNSSIGLGTFLTNAYTFNAGVETKVPLSTYLRTNITYPVDPIVDPTPSSVPWIGSVIERAAVQIKPPTVAALLPHVPPTPTIGQPNEINNADATKTVTGLVKVSSNGFDFYASNCPVSSDLSNPATAPTPPTGCATEIATRPTIGKANAIACFGDVIVELPMRLSDAVFITDAGGCRIYATGTVFIQGTIRAQTVAGAAAPLQISSTRAIVVGFSQNQLGVNSIGGRAASGTGLINASYANSGANPFVTRANDGPGATAALDLIAREAFITNLTTSDTSPYAVSTRDLDYLALSAPYVFSNYRGKFRGAIAAEIALFNELNFVADTRLKGVAPFPLLTGSDAVLKVTP